MSYSPFSDYNIEVRLGNIAGRSMVDISGHNEDLGTTRTTVAPTLDTLDIDQSDLTTTPATVDVASTENVEDVDTTGTGLRSLTLFGLDASGIAQSETILMNGNTEVLSGLTYSAVLGWEALTWGATGFNEGVIWVGNGTFTTGVPATKYFSGDIGHNNGLSAYYVVPAAKTLLLQQIVVNATTAAAAVEIFIETSSDGAIWFTRPPLGFDAGGVITSPIIGMAGLVAGTHVRIQGVASAAATDTTAILSGMLIDD
jgi:hypothetical protein